MYNTNKISTNIEPQEITQLEEYQIFFFKINIYLWKLCIKVLLNYAPRISKYIMYLVIGYGLISKQLHIKLLV